MLTSTHPESHRAIFASLMPGRRNLLKAALIAAAVLGFVQRSAVAGRPGDVPGELYPRGDRFCFTFYSTSEKDSAYALKNGATAIGPYYGGQGTALRLAEQFDTWLLYKVRLPSMIGWRSGNKQFAWPADETICRETAAIVNAVQTNRHIAMWDVEPEELRAWIPAELHYLCLLYTSPSPRD